MVLSVIPLKDDQKLPDPLSITDNLTTSLNPTCGTKDKTQYVQETTFLLSEVEQSRLSISKAADPKRKSQLGQFFTPAAIARFMADLFVRSGYDNCRLLDAGAGIGSLSAAFLDRWASGQGVAGIGLALRLLDPG